MIDLGLLRSIPLYSRLGREYLNSYFKKLDVLGGWIILYTHDVSEKPSAFGTTPEDLQWALQLSLQMGADIQPIEVVVDRLLTPGLAPTGRSSADVPDHSHAH